MMSKLPISRGVHEVAPGVWAFLQPNGSWGLNNAGCIVSEGETLFIDTLFDKVFTRTMLDEYRAQIPGLDMHGDLVVTHANGDHHFGSELFSGRMIATKAFAREMEEMPPSFLADLMDIAPELGGMGAYFQKAFGAFLFRGLSPRKPDLLFEDELSIQVGSLTAVCKDMGPAHTKSDCIVHVPEAGVIFASDLLFIGSTPILWEGPVENWIDACEKLLEMDADVYVPGHGPVSNKKGVMLVRDYWVSLSREAKKHFDAGISARKAARELLGFPYADWVDPERVVINVHSLYRQWDSSLPKTDVAELFDQMSRLTAP
jgi:glyoxylase-like metal-dependent hydrolase (beta-lactamase superfamily II)